MMMILMMEIAHHIRGLNQPRNPKLLSSLKGKLAIVLDVVRAGEMRMI